MRKESAFVLLKLLSSGCFLYVGLYFTNREADAGSFIYLPLLFVLPLVLSTFFGWYVSKGERSNNNNTDRITAYKNNNASNSCILMVLVLFGTLFFGVKPIEVLIMTCFTGFMFLLVWSVLYAFELEKEENKNNINLNKFKKELA